jgi:hypothetical protein
MKITGRYQAEAAAQFVPLPRFANFKSAQFIQMLSHASGKIGGNVLNHGDGRKPSRQLWQEKAQRLNSASRSSDQYDPPRGDFTGR